MSILGLHPNGEKQMNDLFKDDEELPGSLRVRVTPRAKVARIKPEILEDGSICYRVYVNAVAEDGKANKAVIKLLAEAVGLPQSALTIIRGLTSKDKIIQIKN